MIIIVGSTDIKTSLYYKQIDISPSTLITCREDNHTIGHTSIGDIVDLTELEFILGRADAVYWAESSVDEFADSDSYYDFLNWLKDYNLKYNNVVNLDKIKFDVYNWSTDFSLKENHAVFLGCSFTAGDGLPDSNTHYSSIVAKHFDKELLNLGVSAGSNSLIFDRYAQLDFYPGQLVVIQLTNLDRLHYCDTNQKLRKVRFVENDSILNRLMVEIYHKDFLFYELLIKIRAMISIARAKKIKLIFWLINYKDEMIYSKLDQTYFYDMSEFVPASWMENYMLDLGTDNIHPGILSNRFIADTLIKYIETVYKE